MYNPDAICLLHGQRFNKTQGKGEYKEEVDKLFFGCAKSSWKLTIKYTDNDLKTNQKKKNIDYTVSSKNSVRKFITKKNDFHF